MLMANRITAKGVHHGVDVFVNAVHHKFVKKIVCRSNDRAIHIVYKPVGIRCVGSFSTTTLEMIVKKQSEESSNDLVFCQSLTKLETGVAGLCALIVSTAKIDIATLNSLRIVYTFNVLVHNCPPEDWKAGVYVEVPTAGVRQWKKNNTDQHESSSGDVVVKNSETSLVATSSTPLDLHGALFIHVLDSFQVNDQVLSTLVVKSSYDDGRLANAISYVLRKLGYPVVNDRFCKREYSALPRRIKNIVKQKVCIGCYCVDVMYEGESTSVGIDSHNRTRCSFWRETFQLTQN